MSANDKPFPTLRDLASEIGQVQIYWSFLESEMRRELKAVVDQERIARGPIISHWRTYLKSLVGGSNHSVIIDHLEALEKIAIIRNLLAHGIRSANADPWMGGSAHVVCTGPDGVKHQFTIEMIRELSEEIDRVRRSIRETTFLA
ncbi:hypothetical protein [Sinorhizobium meliloti]|uniref:hypothetical protein n=1 Tax=Rhizobium meliloti TaxID=382 RepID=UPI00398CC241